MNNKTIKNYTTNKQSNLN